MVDKENFLNFFITMKSKKGSKNLSLHLISYIYFIVSPPKKNGPNFLFDKICKNTKKVNNTEKKFGVRSL